MDSNPVLNSTQSYEFDGSAEVNMSSVENSQMDAAVLPVVNLSLSETDIVTSTQTDDDNGRKLVPTFFCSQNLDKAASFVMSELHSQSSSQSQPSNVSSECPSSVLQGSPDKLFALRNVLRKLMQLPNRHLIFQQIGGNQSVEEIEKLFLYFINIIQPRSSGYYADDSSLSLVDENDSFIRQKKVKKEREKSGGEECAAAAVLAPVPEESFYSSGGESLDYGNLVYAPWNDQLYLPAKIQHKEHSSILDQQVCSVSFHEPDDNSNEAVQRVENVHYQRIYNHETLPNGSRVLAQVEDDLDGDDGSGGGGDTFASATITQVINSPSRRQFLDRKHVYAYIVKFDDTGIVKPMRREQVRIEPDNLKVAITHFQSVQGASGENRLKTTMVDSLFRELSLTSPSSSDKDLVSSNQKTILKRTIRSGANASLSQSSSTDATNLAKRQQKVFSGVCFVITGYPALSGSGDSQSEMDSEEIVGCEADQLPSEEENEPPPLMTQMQLSCLIRENGGTILNDVNDMHQRIQLQSSEKVLLVAPSYVTTIKYLAALALDIVCVAGVPFVRHCIDKGIFLEPDSYRLPTGWDITSKELIEWDGVCRKNLFKGWTVYLPISMSTTCIPTLIKLTGAGVCMKERMTRSRIELGVSFALVSKHHQFSEDLKRSLENNSIPVLNFTFITDCLANGKILPSFNFMV